MSEMHDIRAWARASGYDVGDKGRLPKAVLEAYEERDDLEDEEPELMEAAPEAAPSLVPPPPEPTAERPPAEAPQPKTGRLFQRKPNQPAKKGQKKPSHPRVSTETLLSTAYGLAAMGLARRGELIPIARVMDMQAPVIGLVGDELIKGTVLDRLLQPIARSGAKAEMAVGIVGPPLLVGIMTARPETFPVLRPALKLSMMTWIEIAEPQMRKVQKRAETWSEKFGDIDLDSMIDALWAGLPAAGPESPMEEEHVRRARGDDTT